RRSRSGDARQVWRRLSRLRPGSVCVRPGGKTMNRLIPLAVLLVVLLPEFAGAQQAPPAIARIEKVRVGFKSYNENAALSRSKTGLWTPVFVEITAGPNGLPKQVGAYLKVEAPDH